MDGMGRIQNIFPELTCDHTKDGGPPSLLSFLGKNR